MATQSQEPTPPPLLGCEPDDLAFRSGDLFPLGVLFGVVEHGDEAPAESPQLPYGLRHAVPVRPEEHGTVIDTRNLTVCLAQQIGLLDGEPLGMWAARTNGKTKIPYDTDTAPKARKDFSEDVKDD